MQEVPCATGANMTRPQLQMPNSFVPLQTSSPFREQGVPPRRRGEPVPVAAAILAVPAVAGTTRVLNDGKADAEADAEAEAKPEKDAVAEAKFEKDAVSEAKPEKDAVSEAKAERE